METVNVAMMQVHAVQSTRALMDRRVRAPRMRAVNSLQADHMMMVPAIAPLPSAISAAEPHAPPAHVQARVIAAMQHALSGSAAAAGSPARVLHAQVAKLITATATTPAMVVMVHTRMGATVSPMSHIICAAIIPHARTTLARAGELLVRARNALTGTTSAVTMQVHVAALSGVHAVAKAVR
jgi:hypothetical protein